MIRYTYFEWEEIWPQAVAVLARTCHINRCAALFIFKEYLKDKMFFDVANETYNVKEDLLKIANRGLIDDNTNSK